MSNLRIASQLATTADQTVLTSSNIWYFFLKIPLFPLILRACSLPSVGWFWGWDMGYTLWYLIYERVCLGITMSRMKGLKIFAVNLMNMFSTLLFAGCCGLDPTLSPNSGISAISQHSPADPRHLSRAWLSKLNDGKLIPPLTISITVPIEWWKWSPLLTVAQSSKVSSGGWVRMKVTTKTRKRVDWWETNYQSKLETYRLVCGRLNEIKERFILDYGLT